MALSSLTYKFKKTIGDKKHSLEHKHVDWNEIDDMAEEDFVDMCPD